MQEGLWKRTGGRSAFIDQDQRVCGNCGNRFLSGVFVVERGYVSRALCKNCAHLHDEKGWEENDA